MDGKQPANAHRLEVRLCVFSITLEWRLLAEELATVRQDELVCVLTPHYLFPCERERVEKLSTARCIFRTFHDLLDLADMEYCDEEADRLAMDRNDLRDGRVTEYYATITLLKNRRARQRLLEEFAVSRGTVFCGDLGLVSSVWCELGLADRTPEISASQPGLWSRVRRALSNPVQCHYLDHAGQRWLLVGRPERVGQYLENGAVTMNPVGRVTKCWFNLQMLAGARLRSRLRVLGPLLRTMNWPWRKLNQSVSQVVATVHEDSLAVASLATDLNLEYANLQDSFLPSYYPSRYLLYRPGVHRYYVWDSFSQGIFNRHGLKSVRWGAYRSWRLPTIDCSGWKPVRRILYLSSGAGDWTALKNRSDEDLALSLLIEAARLRPDITFCYRPHPLWLHPEHQGLNSIHRVISCLESFGLPNIMVSQGARKDGRGFSITGNLSAVSSSVEEDISWADLVMGEHSQTMLVAARQGKVIAGINVSRHPPFFGDYEKVGFPLVSSAEALVKLIEYMSVSSTGSTFIDQYNAAIVRHNRENCGEPVSLNES